MPFISTQRTKILATIGPASSSYENLKALAITGVDAFRLNFSHGTHKDHQEVIERITKINKELGLHVGIIADLQGPKLRIGTIKNNRLDLAPGDIITFVNKECEGTMECIYMNYDQFPTDVEIGERVMIDDGKLVFEVVETNKLDTVKLKTLFGGVLSSKKGVNLPDTKLSLPSLTKKDLVDLEYVMTQPINWLALSFVRSARDVVELKKLVRSYGHSALIISKVEKPEAVEDLEAIVEMSDAIMVARGDLGVEVPMERLPIIQKKIVSTCHRHAKPVIVATQMLESMITNPSPTRAEITDVANAVLDGADCLMLSGETSVGDHPVKVIEAMKKIIVEAEVIFDLSGKQPVPSRASRTFYPDVLCLNAAKTAVEIDAKAIVGMTSSGYTAFQISSYRYKIPVHIFSDKQDTLSMLSIVWGVQCHYYDKFTNTDETIIDVSEILKQADVVKAKDIIVNVGSMPLYKRYRANMMRITLID
ncbi:UNVERIFIED_CONTAM: hypothetical protein GTU68_014442 [Idotea baltica]|nr:hypothetical protein [Idotea baltica]